MFNSPLIRKGLIPALLLIWISGGSLMAQPIGSDNGPRSNQENSPYSRYGIGNIRSPFNSVSRGMGGAAAAATPAFYINSFNPASYSFLTSATIDFAFEASNRSVFMNGNNTRSGTGNFSYFNLGMNAGKHFGFTLGFKPIANMYYNANDSTNIKGLGDVVKNFNGSGNLQFAYLGLAGKYKGLSIGVNFGYAFGNYTYANSLETKGSDSLAPNYHVRSVQLTHKDQIGGIYWQGGILYHGKLKKKKYFNIGLTATLSQQLNVTRNQFALGYNYLIDGSSTDLVIDTITNSKTKGKLTMPASYSFGLAYGKSQQWSVNGTFQYSDWSAFQKMGDREGVGDNAWRASIGGAYTPNDGTASKKYLSYVTYRLGAYYGKDYFHLGNSDINYFGGTVGVSLPLQRKYNNFGSVNLSLDIGQRGSITNGLAREVYANFTFGISFNDTYWLKRPARYH